MKELLQKIADRVEEAVRASMADPELASEVGMGKDGTPTSKADKVAEDAALAALEEAGSDMSFLSEEAGFIDRGGKDVLVIDPVDGTYNLVHRLPFYSVSLAVGRQQLSRVTHALVRNLATRETYYAEKGAGATLDGRPISTRKFHSKDAVFNVYMGMLANDKAPSVAHNARRIRAYGCASLEMCMVAEGQSDLYYVVTAGVNHTMRVTDIAASTLILREAGGEVYDAHMVKLDVELDLRPRFNVIAVGDKKVLGVLA